MSRDQRDKVVEAARRFTAACLTDSETPLELLRDIVHSELGYTLLELFDEVEILNSMTEIAPEPAHAEPKPKPNPKTSFELPPLGDRVGRIRRSKFRSPVSKPQRVVASNLEAGPILEAEPAAVEPKPESETPLKARRLSEVLREAGY